MTKFTKKLERQLIKVTNKTQKELLKMKDARKLSELVNFTGLAPLKDSIEQYNSALVKAENSRAQLSKTYRAEEVEKRIEEQKNEVQQKFLKIADGHLDSMLNSQESAKNALNKILFPNLSEDVSRNAGEMQISQAASMLNSGKLDTEHLNRIINEIEFSVELDRRDYVSYLLRILDLENAGALINNTKKKNSLISIEKLYMEKIGANKEKERVEAYGLGAIIAQQFLSDVKIKRAAIFPYSFSEMESFTVNQATENLNKVNRSMDFWGQFSKVA